MFLKLERPGPDHILANLPCTSSLSFSDARQMAGSAVSRKSPEPSAGISNTINITLTMSSCFVFKQSESVLIVSFKKYYLITAFFACRQLHLQISGQSD